MAWVNGKSGTYNISTNNQYISGYVAWSEQYDVAANKSLVKQTAYLHRTNIYSGATYFNSESLTRYMYFGSDTVGGTETVSMSIPGNTSSSGGEYIQVYTASKEIAHNADGSKSVTLGFSMSKSDTVSVVANSFTVPKATATVALTTIPRGTTPSLSDNEVTMGEAIDITLSPADSSFKHKLRYEFGSLVSQINGFKINGTQITSDFITGTKITFTPPTSLGDEIYDSMSGTLKLIVYTYKSDGTSVDTKTVNITVSVPSYTLTVKDKTITGNNLLNGAYVQGKSSINGFFSATTMYGAEIKSYAITVDGKTYNSSKFTTDVLSSGEKTILCVITDTRGVKFTGNLTEKITVYPYAAPQITEFTFTRNATTPSTVVAKVKGTVSSVNNKNAKIVKVEIDGQAQQVTASSYTVDTSITFTGVDTDSTLTGKATLSDSYTSFLKDAVLPTVAVTMDFLYTGNGIAMGKVSETEDLFECAWNAKFKKNLEVAGTLTVSGKSLLNLIYPVGSIYMSVNNTSPATLFGGTWTQLKDNFLLGAGDTYAAGSTGGEATHTLSVNEIPSHNHPYGVYASDSTNSLAVNHMASYCGKVNSTGWGSHTLYTGGGAAHNNMPPYLTVYMWKRTA